MPKKDRFWNCSPMGQGFYAVRRSDGKAFEVYTKETAEWVTKLLQDGEALKRSVATFLEVFDEETVKKFEQTWLPGYTDEDIEMFHLVVKPLINKLRRTVESMEAH